MVSESLNNTDTYLYSSRDFFKTFVGPNAAHRTVV